MGIYLALGDSISIDDYTGVRGGGAPSQLARRLGLELVDLTRDGNTTQGVLADLARAPAAADIVTLTAGGNDLLCGDLPRAILRRLHEIAQRIQSLGALSSSTPSTTQATATTTWDGGVAYATVGVRSRLQILRSGFYYNVHAKPASAAKNPEIACANVVPIPCWLPAEDVEPGGELTLCFAAHDEGLVLPRMVVEAGVSARLDLEDAHRERGRAVDLGADRGGSSGLRSPPRSVDGRLEVPKDEGLRSQAQQTRGPRQGPASKVAG
jgi:hypothetical protein